VNKGEKRIGLFLLSDANSHQVASGRGAQAAARRLGIPLDVSFADNLAAQQAQNVIRFLHANEGRQVGVILMPIAQIDSPSVDDHPVHKLARRVASRGAAWISLNRDARQQVAALHREFPRLPIGMVTPDQKEFGRIQGRQFKALLPRGGRILYVAGNPFSTSTRERRAGMREVVGDNAAFKIDEVDGLWSAEPARKAVSKWLLNASHRGDWPDLVGCQNDEMAMGSRDALQEAARSYSHARLGRIPVTGGDGLPDEGQRWVGERKLTATIVAPISSTVAVEQLARSWTTGEPMPLVNVLPVSPFPSIEALAPVRA
jgi:ABC-type sugar transport system substrate-binding protein